jgi:hypothetical protein
MELLDQDRLQKLLRELLKARPAPGVSIYMETRPGGAGARKDPIQLKNLLKEAERQLNRHRSQQGKQDHELLAPVRTLVENRELWRRTAGGLALFCSAELRRGLVWPRPFPPTCVVGNHFHTRPLISLLRDTRPYYVLAVSPKATRLLRCTRFSAERIEHPLLPADMSAALPFDDPERQLQYHTYGAGGGQGAVFHGHEADRSPQDRDRRYLLVIREAIGRLLADEKAPLVIVMTETLAALYRDVNRYPFLIESPVTTSPDPLGDGALRDMGWDRVEPLLRQEEGEAADRLMDLIGTDRAATDIDRVVPLAAQGRVDALFIATDGESWGAATDHTVSTELLDLAARSTLLNRGTVYEVPAALLPDGEQVAAILRY